MQRFSQRATEFGWRVKSIPPSIWATAGLGLAAGLLIVILAQPDLTLVLLLMTPLAASALIFLRQYALAAALALVAAIFFDFYPLDRLPLGEPVVGLFIASVLIAFFLLAQADQLPWIKPRYIAVWLIFLLLTALAVPRGPLLYTRPYFVTTIITSYVFYLLGTQVTRDYGTLRRLLTWLLLIASLIAAHSIVLVVTGRFLFETERQAAYLRAREHFPLGLNTPFIRAGSFLEHPDWNSAFLALMAFVAAGLLFSASTRRAQVFYVAQLILLLIALLFTFSTTAIFAATIGAIIFELVVIPARYKLRVLLFGIVGIASFLAIFHQQVAGLWAHTTNPFVLIRLGACETALRVIRAYPLTGVGMSDYLYLVRAEPFRVPLQTDPLAHPHNAYLELAAFAGIPVILAFLALAGLLLCDAIRLFRAADPTNKIILGSVITSLIVFSINSFFINGWTLPPLAALAWLLFGAVTSRALQPPPHVEQLAAGREPVG
jgi:O-antigen ligase